MNIQWFVVIRKIYKFISQIGLRYFMAYPFFVIVEGLKSLSKVLCT